MGNSSSSGRGHHDDTVDFGYLTPQGIYTGPRDWNQSIVTQHIIDRKLAPFYRPLEDYERPLVVKMSAADWSKLTWEIGWMENDEM